MNKIVIAIDGPAGAGKGSASRALADRLDYTYIDTGAMYRAVALIAKEQGVAWDDDRSLGEIATALNFAFTKQANQQHIIVDGRDISHLIRTPEISQGSSIIGKQGSLVKALIVQQQRLGANGGIVMEGRQIGTEVFPNAEVKIYLTASPEERASRRQLELKERGQNIDFEQVLADIRERDKRDSERTHGPLRKAADAIELNTDNLNLEQAIDELERIVRNYLSSIKSE